MAAREVSDDGLTKEAYQKVADGSGSKPASRPRNRVWCQYHLDYVNGRSGQEETIGSALRSTSQYQSRAWVFNVRFDAE